MELSPLLRSGARLDGYERTVLNVQILTRI